MFTGIIEEIGVLQAVKKGKESSVLEIRAEKVLEHTKIGDSIAVNGDREVIKQMLWQKLCGDQILEHYSPEIV